MRTLICSLLLVAACLACGCSGARQVRGKILKGGQPYTLSDKGQFVLSFIPASGSDQTLYPAKANPDGTFIITGPLDKGIPPGKYKVHLTAQDPYAGPASPDKLEGKYGIGKSTLVVDVGPGELTIDLPK